MSTSSISTSSGWNRGTSTPKPQPKKPGVVRGIVAGLVVVAILATAAVFLFSGDKGTVGIKESKPAKIKESKPAKVQEAEAPKKVEKPAKPEKKKPNIEWVNGRQVNHDLKAAFTTTNPPTMRGPADRYREAIAQGRRPLFNNACDLILQQYAIPGEMSPPPPITPDLKNAYINSIMDKIEITDEDSPRDREIKEGVIALRQELKEWIKGGGEFEDYMRKLQARQEQEHYYVSEARSMIEKNFKESGDIDATLELWRAYNKKLESDGLRKTALPKGVRIYFLKNKLEIPEE